MKKILKEKLKGLPADKLAALVDHICTDNDAYISALEWLERYSAKNKPVKGLKKNNVDDELLEKYASKAFAAADDSDDYDGWHDDGYNPELYTWLDKISKLGKKGRLSFEAKKKFISEALEMRRTDEFAAEDVVTAIFDICGEKKDWLYVIEKLGKSRNESDIEIIIQIKKDRLKDESGYIEERLKKLETSYDYNDLAMFYAAKNDLKSAIQTAEKGISDLDKGVDILFGSLLGFYARSKDDEKIETLSKTAIVKCWKKDAAYELLFDHYKKRDNYENAKAALANAFKESSDEDSTRLYKVAENFLFEKDWLSLKDRFLNKVRSGDFGGYLKILIAEGRKDEALKELLSGKKDIPYYSYSEYLDVAEMLKKDFPEPIASYYLKLADRIATKTFQSRYRDARDLLLDAKDIYLKCLKKESEWNKII
ncbi:MAG TPA: hypothetical protein PKK26_16860, partial [Candidatus Wallbacteria bacterium]|nr:hypothetical protein [Candidatus Wallbacteria bacterium]